MTNAGATSSKNSQGNVDENQRDIVGGPIYKTKVKKRVISRKDLGLKINSLNRFNYNFNRSNL